MEKPLKYGTSPAGKEFVPLLFAGDINVYSVARAFYEAYGCMSYGYGKFATGVCMNSAFLSYSANPKVDQPETFMELVYNFAKDHSDMTVLLIGCGDRYVELISAARDHLPANVIAPYIDFQLMEHLTHKEEFYKLCDEKGIDRPDTFVYHCGESLDFTLPFGGPFIVKPSNGPEYWAHPYETQKKVYKVDTVDQVKNVLMDIYGAGYEDSVIIQNFIPGDDSYMHVLTGYADRNGKVTMMCLGHVLLEEHTPHGLGNHAVIIADQDEELCEKFRGLLEDLGFRGFFNFDIKFDKRDETYKVFEINCRQGRSNYYVTASGGNLAKYVVEDRIDKENRKCTFIGRMHLWANIPLRVAGKYISNNYFRQQLLSLVVLKEFDNPLRCRAEKSLKRWFYITRNQLGHYIKFRKYLGKQR